MSNSLTAPHCGRPNRRRTRFGAALFTGFMCFSLVGLAFVAPAPAAPMITLGGGVVNPPPNKQTTALPVQQTAIADKAVLVPVATFGTTLQSLLTMQNFSNANNWTLDTTTVSLDPNATFNLTQYNLTLNPAGTKFGEVMKFTLNPNLASPAVPAGSTATLHWIQLFNTSTATANSYAGTQLAAPDNTGYWYLDNGFVGGAKVDATNNGAGTNNGNNGPYYDSNNVPATSGMTFMPPPNFSDSPGFFGGVGYFLHFEAIPVWDIYTPAKGPAAATDVMMAGNYAVAWGFRVVPEPSSVILLSFGFVSFVVFAWRRKGKR